MEPIKEKGKPPSRISKSFEYYKELKKQKRREIKKEINKNYYLNVKTHKHESSTKDALWKRNQRKQMKEKIEKSMRAKTLHNERQKRYQKAKRDPPILLTDDSMYTTPYNNRMAKSRAIGRFRTTLPISPMKRAQLMVSYLDTKSPTVQRLKQMKIVKSKEKTKHEDMSQSVIQDLKTALLKTNKRRSDENIQSRNLIFSAMSGENVTEKKCKKRLSMYLGVHHRNIAGGQRTRTKILKDESSSWKLTKKRARKNKISDINKRVVYDFWLSNGISRPTGNKKDIKRERLSAHVFVSHSVQVLEVSQTEAYTIFKKKHPNISISQRSFEKLKPFFVRPVKETDRNTCMCRYHVELKTVLKSCMKRRCQFLDRSGDESNDYPIYHSVSDLVKQTLCEKDNDEEHYNQACIDRKCNYCGVAKLVIMAEEESEDLVQLERFEYVEVPSKSNTVRKKLMLVQKKTSSREMFNYLRKLLEPFASHQFRALWQNIQMKQNISLLPQNDVVCIHDFSENYRVAAKEELQSDYFQRMEVTVHVTILRRHAKLEIDALESTEENPEIVTEQFIVISPDDKHDHHFVHRVQVLVHEYLRSIGYETNTMHEWTDGCQAQYKSRHCMGDFSYGVNDFGCKRVIRNYFETSHAKGPQDAAGGYIKRQLDTAILRGKAVIQSAHDVFKFVDENLRCTGPSSNCSRRIFRYVDTIDRNRNRYFKPVKGNRNIHQIMSCEAEVLKLANLSCYSCENCIESNYDRCLNEQRTSVRNIVMELSKNESHENDENLDHTIRLPFSVKDTVKSGSIVVVYTDDENDDYFLLRAKEPATILERHEKDDWGNTFPKSSEVIRGEYYQKVNSLKFNIVKKKTIISVNSVVCVLDEVESKAKITVPENVHERVLSWVEECTENFTS